MYDLLYIIFFKYLAIAYINFFKKVNSLSFFSVTSYAPLKMRAIKEKKSFKKNNSVKLEVCLYVFFIMHAFESPKIDSK